MAIAQRRGKLGVNPSPKNTEQEVFNQFFPSCKSNICLYFVDF